MLYFANPCGPDVIAAMQAGTIGYIDTPAQGNARPAGVAWCLDNGAYSDNFDEAKWWATVVNNAPYAASCAFAVAPDVVGDAEATLVRSRPWLAEIRGLGYPVAYVAQNGFADHFVPWDDFDVLFIGGTTEWKLGPHAIEAAHQAKLRGKRVHVGRVNSEKRFRFAAAPYPHGLGADSADGTFLTFGPDVNLPKVLAWTRLNDQDDLFGGAA